MSTAFSLSGVSMVMVPPGMARYSRVMRVHGVSLRQLPKPSWMALVTSASSKSPTTENSAWLAA